MNNQNNIALPKVIVVCGPTATGKSDKAVEIALKIGGEIISADSRQVYRGLDIGSGKITQAEMKGVPHHLLDVADPQDVFSAEDFRHLGEQALNEIFSRGNIPIICGGTGFYIDVLTHDIQIPQVEPNHPLRSQLSKDSLETLQKKLKTLAPERYATIDIKNPVRLVRAIEIATALGYVPQITHTPQYNIEYVYLDYPDEVLKERIYTRLHARLEAGMLEEARTLHDSGLSYERMKQLGLEYRYMAMHILGELSYEEMCDQLVLKIWQFAKRQRTWFKKYIQS